MATRYWVNGAGNWSSSGNWSTISGGGGGASVPTSTDDAIIDANSGFGAKFVVTVDTSGGVPGQTVGSLTISQSAPVGVQIIRLQTSLTIVGAFSTSGTAGNNRILFRSGNGGTDPNVRFDLTLNGSVSISDVDFNNINIKGTAAPISGTRIGNLGYNTNLNASAPKTVYWNSAAGGNWSSTAWATSSGGGVSTDNHPLAQDTAIIENTGLNTSATITLDSAIPYLGTINMSTRTNAMTLAGSTTYSVYGNWTLGSGVTQSYTGTAIFSGWNKTQTITSSGKSWSGSIGINAPSSTIELADALSVLTNNIVPYTGTFDTKNQAVTAGAIATTTGYPKGLKFGSSTITLSLASGLQLNNTYNLDFDCGTSTVNLTNNTSCQVTGGSVGLPALTFYNLVYTSTSSSSFRTLSVASGTTINSVTLYAPVNPGNSTFFRADATAAGGGVVNIGTFASVGALPTNRISISSNSSTSQTRLNITNFTATDCDFSRIILSGAASSTTLTRAGNLPLSPGNSGIIFPAPKTVYWNLGGTANWHDAGWAASSGGMPDSTNYPLVQDTAVFDNAGSAGTVSLNSVHNIGTINMSARTSAMTFNLASTASVSLYGNLTLGTGVTLNSASTNSLSMNNMLSSQTITSNGVQLGCGLSLSGGASVKLNDALYLNCSLAVGIALISPSTFDANNCNVTAPRFSIGFGGSGVPVVKLGSGTWTILGTGTVWDINSTTVAISGSANILLYDTSTTSRTFNGGGAVSSYVYYNKLTIGAPTGVSTLTISGYNTFGELASTKTVAHTILFPGAQPTNVGKWSVTGTLGNVVTIGPASAATVYTIDIFGPATSGIDYLSISYCTSNSYGEFYAGANSTNGGSNTGVIFTATPAARTLYWVGGSGNWSSTTKWSTSSGGASGAAIPTSLDSVIFNSASSATSYTATVDVFARCAAFTMAGPASGNVTFDGTQYITFNGNVSFAATGVVPSGTNTPQIYLAGNSSYTFNTNNFGFLAGVSVLGVGSTWTLGSALNISSYLLEIRNGSFSTSASNYALTVNSLIADYQNIRSINFNGSTVTAGDVNLGTSQGAADNLTFSGSSSTINNVGVSFWGASKSFGTVVMRGNANTTAINGANTFVNLTFSGRDSFAGVGVSAFTFSADQTISGTLTLNAGAASAYRTYLVSDTIGTTRTLTVNSLAAGATDVDFRDITIAGAAAPISGTRLGNARGNSGITFPAAKTVYWRTATTANWGATGSGSWAATDGGAADATMFPLAQDTAVFPSGYPNSGVTVTINAAYNIGSINMSARTANTMTLATGTTSLSVYGSWTNGTGVTLTGTGTLTFTGRGSQNLSGAGVTFPHLFTINNPGGTVSLQSAFVASNSSSSVLTITQGTFDANGYNVTLSGAASGVSSSNSNVRTIAVGSGTWTIAGTGGWATNTSTNLTVTGTGTISLTSSSTKTFAGGSISYSNLTVDQGGSGTLTISGSNTFKNISNSYNVTGPTTINITGTSTTLTQFTAAGYPSNVLTVTGPSITNPCTLRLTSGTITTGIDYLNLTWVLAYSSTNQWVNTWYAGANSTNGGTLGWVFSPTNTVWALAVSESATAYDITSGLLVCATQVNETSNISDASAGNMTVSMSITDTVRVSDSSGSSKLWNLIPTQDNQPVIWTNINTL